MERGLVTFIHSNGKVGFNFPTDEDQEGFFRADWLACPVVNINARPVPSALPPSFMSEFPFLLDVLDEISPLISNGVVVAKQKRITRYVLEGVGVADFTRRRVDFYYVADLRGNKPCIHELSPEFHTPDKGSTIVRRAQSIMSQMQELDIPAYCEKVCLVRIQAKRERPSFNNQCTLTVYTVR